MLWVVYLLLLFIPILCLLLGKETLWLIWHTLPRDLRFGRVLLKIKMSTEKMKRENVSIVELFEETARKYPKRTMFKFQGCEWTFEEVEREANGIAAFFHHQGLQKGKDEFN